MQSPNYLDDTEIGMADTLIAYIWSKQQLIKFPLESLMSSNGSPCRVGQGGDDTIMKTHHYLQACNSFIWSEE